MQRRKFLGVTAAATLPLAGCSGFGSGGGPGATARDFLRAVYAEDQARMLELTHDEGPMEENIDDGGFSAPGHELTVEETTVTEKGDGRARVTVAYTHPNGEQLDPHLQLQTADGEWRVWTLDWL